MSYFSCDKEFHTSRHLFYIILLIKFWNKIPLDIESVQNLNLFINILKKATSMTRTEEP